VIPYALKIKRKASGNVAGVILQKAVLPAIELLKYVLSILISTFDHILS
jgi:hypothetical protein